MEWRSPGPTSIPYQRSKMPYKYDVGDPKYAWFAQQLLIKAGWPRRDVPGIIVSWERSLWVGLAFHEKHRGERSSPKLQMVGMARLVGDGIFTAVLFDVVVHPQHRRIGIGRKLVEMSVLYAKGLGVGEVECCAAPGASEFYEALGWRHKDAFAWKFGKDSQGDSP